MRDSDDFHFTGFTEATLRMHLLAAGFEVGSFSVDEGWLLSVEAQKEYAWSRVVAEAEGLRDGEYIHELYRFAFDREPDGDGLAFLRTELKRGRMTRDGAARHLLSSPERLYLTAARAGL